LQIRYPGIFFLVLSIYVCRVSLKLGLGTLHKPGSGFISFWSGIMLGILTIMMLIQNIWLDKADRAEEKKEKTHWRTVVLALVSLFICILIFERVGFIISTTLFVGFLFKGIEREGWFVTILASLLMTFASYYIFKVLLQAELPKGIFGF
jgi:putative tricarboxylic transport membrane protein